MALEHPWSEPPAAAQTIEVAPGVRWVRMPLPFQLDHINLWALADLDRRVAHYRRHGVAEEHTAKMRARGNPYPSLVGGLPFHFMPIADGEATTIDGRRWRVITARGHSPVHACLWCEDLRVLIAGDQVLPKITTNVSVWPERPAENPLRYYLDSLARFLRLPADTLILPSHGRPFRGLHHRLSTLVQHDDARLAEAA